MNYKNVNDYELMYRIKEKDDEAFEMLFNKYEPIIIGIAKKYSSYTKKYGVEFLYRDFRPNFREKNKEAREKGFYMQKYCGCVFSEEERYIKRGKIIL